MQIRINVTTIRSDVCVACQVAGKMQSAVMSDITPLWFSPLWYSFAYSPRVSPNRRNVWAATESPKGVVDSESTTGWPENVCQTVACVCFSDVYRSGFSHLHGSQRQQFVDCTGGSTRKCLRN